MATKRASIPKNKSIVNASKDSQKQPTEKVETSSGIEIKPFYKPQDVTDLSEECDLGKPGEYPFTRGIYPGMYRRRLWTMRQYAGFGTAAESNQRYKYLLSQGQNALS